MSMTQIRVAVADDHPVVLAGIRSLLNLRRLLFQRQQRLLLVIPEGSVLMKALDVGGVAAVVPIYDSLSSARAEGGQSA
jgi:hypothetical protein